MKLFLIFYSVFFISIFEAYSKKLIIADISNNKAIVNDPYFSSFVDGSVTESGLGMNYLYVKTAESNWDYLAKLSRSDAAANSWFGRSGVEITNNGFALVADPYSESGVHPASASGGIYI